jgi:hypothetical protein
MEIEEEKKNVCTHPGIALRGTKENNPNGPNQDIKEDRGTYGVVAGQGETVCE